MARVQLVIPDEDRDRFVSQARRENMTLSAWFRVAARQRLERQQRSDPFGSPEDVEAFFRWCDTLDDLPSEPNWSDHRAVIDASRRRGTSGT